MTRRGLDRQDPVPDYHDTGRPNPGQQKARPSAQPPSKGTETGNPTTENEQKGMTMIPQTTAPRQPEHADEFTLTRQPGNQQPKTLADYAARPSVTTHRDLNGTPELYERHLIQARGVQLEEFYAPPTSTDPAELTYSLHIRREPLTLAQVRTILTDALALLPDSEAGHLSRLTGQPEPAPASVQTIRAELAEFYAPAPEDQRPHPEQLDYMAEQLHAEGLDLGTATVSHLNRLATTERPSR